MIYVKIYCKNLIPDLDTSIHLVGFALHTFAAVCVFHHVRYPPINKPAAVVHWINHVKTDAEYVVILDSDMIMKGPITPWEFNADKGRPVSAPNE